MKMDKPKEFFELLFNLASYSYPETITLPADYVSPSMAVKLTYWKVKLWKVLFDHYLFIKNVSLLLQIFTILTLYSAHNPSVVGALAYEEFPMFRCFLEMCITNQFEFPPPSIAEPGSEMAEQLKKQDLTMTEKERKDILTVSTVIYQCPANL